MKSFIDLTDRFPMSFDVEKMKAELTALENRIWIRHYDTTQPSGWTTIPLRSIKGSLDGPDSIRHGSFDEYANTPLLNELPYLRAVVGAFKCPVGRVRLSKMDPGTVINPHRDVKDEVASVAFGQVRLHIPITTNERVSFFIGDACYRMLPGRLYYADFSKKHSVRNDGNVARVHLFLELRMNDWLEGLFPSFSPLERIEMILQRAYLPLMWKVRSIWLFNRYIAKFWKVYEGSVVQAGWRSLRTALYKGRTRSQGHGPLS